MYAKLLKNAVPALLLTTFLAAPSAVLAQSAGAFEPLTIQDQGSFAVGGTVLETPGAYNNNAPTAEGQSFHGDHLYTFYQVPQDALPLPIVMLHGAFQSGRSWETTSDGREGFQTIFLRKGYSVYLVDQPRRGRAGNSTEAATIEPTPNDQLFFDQFRLGTWPDYFENVQFDRSPETLDRSSARSPPIPVLITPVSSPMRWRRCSIRRAPASCSAIRRQAVRAG